MASSTPRTAEPAVLAAPERARRARRLPRPGPGLVSLALLLVAWAVAAVVSADPQVLPTPWRVAALIAAETASGELPGHLAATLARTAGAFALAMGVGMALGLLMGRSETANRALDPWLIVFLNLPALVVIVLCYLWIGLNETAAVLAVALGKIPLVAAMLREGARALDPKLDAMARVYGMSARDRLVHVVLPQLAPQIAAAARTGLAIIWKVVLVVEFLGRPNGVGFQIHMWFSLFDVARVLAYAVSFVAVMMAIEHLVLQPLERRARRWRTA